MSVRERVNRRLRAKGEGCMTNQTIPPCPVCGVVLEQMEEISTNSCDDMYIDGFSDACNTLGAIIEKELSK